MTEMREPPADIAQHPRVAEWQQAAADRRAAMLARREEVSAAHPEITMAYELAPLMGDLEPEYWNWQLERYIARELGEDGE